MTRNDLMLSSMAVQMEQIVFKAQMNKAMLLLALLIVGRARGKRGGWAVVAGEEELTNTNGSQCFPGLRVFAWS